MRYLIQFRVEFQVWFSPIFGQVQGSFKGSFFIEKTSIHLYAPGFLAGVARGGRGYGCAFHSLTRPSVKLDHSNFGQDVTLGKDKNIDNGVTVIDIIVALLSIKSH